MSSSEKKKKDKNINYENQVTSYSYEKQDYCAHHCVTALNKEYSPYDYVTNFGIVTAKCRNIRWETKLAFR